jgi:hypothetical protein
MNIQMNLPLCMLVFCLVNSQGFTWCAISWHVAQISNKEKNLDPTTMKKCNLILTYDVNSYLNLGLRPWKKNLKICQFQF